MIILMGQNQQNKSGTALMRHEENPLNVFSCLVQKITFSSFFRCRDYVTEQFFNMYNLNMIPVVIGGANYSAIAPPHSFINAADFPK